MYLKHGSMFRDIECPLLSSSMVPQVLLVPCGEQACNAMTKAREVQKPLAGERPTES